MSKDVFGENISDIVEIAEKFGRICKDAPSLDRMCDAEIEEADKAFGDLRHYCELRYPKTPKERTKVCQLIKEYSDKRRGAKDMKAVLAPLIEFLHGINNNKLFEAIAKAKKEAQKVNGERIYNPRVLEELFKE